MRHKIGYCDLTNNPFHGCWHGCAFCYARRFSKRLAGHAGSSYFYLKEDGLDPFAPAFSPSKMQDLDRKLRRAKKPRRIFLGSMGDLGGGWSYVQIGPFGLTGEILDASYVRNAVRNMARRHAGHTFLILTKNPAGLALIEWPDNVHIGVSVANNRDAVRRVKGLFFLGVGIRWVSIEPLLDHDFDPASLRGVGWVVIGAETGPGADEPRVWAKAAKRIVEWCGRAGIPCFVKDNLVKGEPSYGWPREIPNG